MTVELDSIEEALRERREDRHIPFSDIVRNLNAAGIKASQSRLSDVERQNATSFTKYWRTPRERLAALREYKFAPDEISKLNHKHDLGLSRVLGERATVIHRAEAGGPTVRHYGSVNAGVSLADLPEEDIEHVSVPDWIADRYDLERVFSMDITGSSMACDDVQKSLPEGSRVYFLESAEPVAGEIVCFRLFDENLHVIKLFQAHESYAVLESYNHDHPPIIVNEDNPGNVVGVYLTHIPRGPRLR